jgi:hypothetical protein
VTALFQAAQSKTNSPEVRAAAADALKKVNK